MTSPLPKSIKKELAALGYKTPDRQDLTTFQAARGLKASAPGVVDAQTKKALDYASKFASQHASVFIQGEQNGSIKTAEHRLAALGYDVGPVDGTFDGKTANAMQAFKKDHPSLKNTYRYMGKAARAVLGHELQNRSHTPWHVRVNASASQRKVDAQTRTAAATGIAEGAKGPTVKNVERHLSAAGFSPQKLDGTFDGRTTSAVKAFQAHAKLPVTGTVDARTWAALSKSMVLGKSGPMTQGEHSYDVQKAERVLRKLGYKRVKADGVFDASTASAVRAFEKKNKLKVDGAISAGELKRMEKDAAKGKGTNAYDIAHQMLGKSAIWMQTHGPLAKYMDNGVPQNVNCANFVSSCLQYAGLISNGQHDDTVSGLSKKLDADKDWSRTSLGAAKPGDVCVVVGGDHVVMFAGRDKSGNPLFIGSNNREDLAGHPQFVSVHGGYSPIKVFHYHG